jgi:hypothetical protein
VGGGARGAERYGEGRGRAGGSGVPPLEVGVGRVM